jgi:hypothetical protein
MGIGSLREAETGGILKAAWELALQKSPVIFIARTAPDVEGAKGLFICQNVPLASLTV